MTYFKYSDAVEILNKYEDDPIYKDDSSIQDLIQQAKTYISITCYFRENDKKTLNEKEYTNGRDSRAVLELYGETSE